MKKFNLLLVSIITALVGFGACSKTAEYIGANADYIIIHSRSREQSSGIFCIDEKGAVTEKLKSSKMQDLSFFSFNDSKLIVSGGRRNNNMLFDLRDDGKYSTLHWLNAPQYSGVTAVQLMDNSMLAIMNGNYTDTTYLNLLVEQDYEGRIVQQATLELYVRDVSVVGNEAKVAGKHLSKSNNINDWKASILNYNISDQKIIGQYNYAEYNCFWEIIDSDTLIYCLAEDKDENINTICTINKNTFEIENQLQIDDQLCGMYLEENTLYAVGNEAVYEVVLDSLTKKDSYSHDMEKNGYIDWAYVYEGHYYMLFRYFQRIKRNSTYEYGILFNISLESFEKTQTPIRYSVWTTIDDLFIFPREMFKTYIE